MGVEGRAVLVEGDEGGDWRCADGIVGGTSIGSLGRRSKKICLLKGRFEGGSSKQYAHLNDFFRIDMSNKFRKASKVR